jgi:hypothetical protein
LCKRTVAEQLIGIDGLRVDDIDMHGFELADLCVMQRRECLLQQSERRGLGRHGGSDEHVSMSRSFALVQLDHLVDEGLVDLETVLLQLSLDLGAQDRVVQGGQFHRGEHIGQQRVEQHHVLGDQLRSVHVLQGAHEDQFFAQVESLAAVELSRAHQHGLDGAESIGIVRLFAELFLDERVDGGDFLGEHLCFLEPFALQDDLGDHLTLRNHHRHGTEQGFQVVGQLCAAGVTGVHRDEDAEHKTTREKKETRRHTSMSEHFHKCSIARASVCAGKPFVH